MSMRRDAAPPIAIHSLQSMSMCVEAVLQIAIHPHTSVPAAAPDSATPLTRRVAAE
jgi:hypothetical protein